MNLYNSCTSIHSYFSYFFLPTVKPATISIKLAEAAAANAATHPPPGTGLSDAVFLKKSFIVSNLNWIGFDFQESIKVKVKIRYNQAEKNAIIHPFKGGNILVEFDTPQRAIAPGQSAVFYQDDIVIGGGIIKRGV